MAEKRRRQQENVVVVAKGSKERSSVKSEKVSARKGKVT